MIKIFLINERVAFYPQENLLTNVQDSETSQAINEPCARCLEILLDNHGQIVSHDDLYQVAWPDAYKTTSPNTLYQNILLARKALKEVSGSDEDFIITIPRKGFSFNETIPVTVQNEIPVISVNPNQGEGATVTKEESIYSPDNKFSIRRFFSKNIRLFTFSAFLLSLIFFAQAFYQHQQFTRNDFTSDYYFLKKSGECRIYLNNRSLRLKETIDTNLETKPMLTAECRFLPEVYITAYYPPERIFFLSCNKPEKVGRKCKTGYLRP